MSCTNCNGIEVPIGPQGPQGPAGPQGPPGEGGDSFRTTSTHTINLFLLSGGDTLSLTVDTELDYTEGQIVLVRNDDSNYFYATVLSYDEITGVLDLEIIEVVGTGNFNSWELNLGVPTDYLLNRTNHTGTQSQSTITNLTSDLASKGDMFKLTYDADNNGVVDDSQRFSGQLPSYYLNRSNHTGSQLQSTIVNLTSDLALKEDVANKGAANGYTPLVGGLVPLIYLPPGTPNQYLGLYDASTNTPVIANGSGTAGQFYIANVTGNAYAPVNVTVVNQIVAYDGAVWQVGAVFTGGIADVNGQTGPSVSLDLDDIADTATRFAVDADQIAALNVPSANAGNKFVTESQLSGIDYFVTPQFYGALNSTSTFASLGITQPTIDATYPGTGAVTTDTVDWAATQYAINQSLSTGKTLRTYGTYYLNRGLTVQPTAYETEWIWEGNGATLQTTNNNSFTVVTIGVPTQQETSPLDPTDAMWLVNNTYNVSRLKVRIDTNQIGFDFGPSYSSQYNQLLVFGNDGGTGIISKFNLNATFNNCNIRGCLYGFRLRSGDTLWTGATTSNSQCNHTVFQNCRVSWQNVGTPGEIGFDIVDASGVGIYDSIIEGTKVKKGINLSSQLTTVLTFSAKNVHYECTQGTDVAGVGEAFLYARTLGAFISLDNIYGQYASILANTGISSGGGSTTLKLSNTRYWVDKVGEAFYNNGNTNYISEFNDSIFFLSASWPGLIAGTAVSLCGGVGCGNNKYSHYTIPR